MAQSTMSAHAVAREASKASKRNVSDKQVRSLARDFIPRFDKATHPAYQSHEYDAAESRWLVAAFVARSKGQAVTPFGAPKRRTRKATPKVESDATV